MHELENFIDYVNKNHSVISMKQSVSFWNENLINVSVFKKGNYWTEVLSFWKCDIEKKWNDIETEICRRVRIIFNEEL